MSERYQPTPEDITRNIMHSDMIKLSGDQVFNTVQGEGDSLGKPATFMRLHECNLECSWCDTKYTWDKSKPEYWQEPQDWKFDDLAKEVLQYPTKRIVITGGEPLIQQQQLAKFVQLIPEDVAIEIETNGTIKPNETLAQRAQFNVSPKLENSGNEIENRFRLKTLQSYVDLPKAFFKFVAQEASDLDEVDEIVKATGMPPERVMVMPEGTDVDTLREHALNIVDGVKDRGYRLMPRMHVAIWGNQRKV